MAAPSGGYADPDTSPRNTRTLVPANIPAVDLPARRPASLRQRILPRDLATPFRLGVLILVVLTAIWRAWTMSRWSWFMDDWIYLSSTTDMSFQQFVTQNYNGHVMPGQFSLIWLLTRIAPMNYGVAVAVTCVFMIASLLAWTAALRELFGERWHLLYALTILGLSPIFVP